MKRKTQTRHKAEEIEKSVARVQGGESISAVAKSLGVSKSLVAYWIAHADRLIPSTGTSALTSPKNALRTRKFIEQCLATIALAFQRLKIELKKDAPKGVKDLGLLIAVLYDKQTQAAQRLEGQAPRAAQDWSASEDTLLILRQHRETGVARPPAENIVVASREPSGLEQQKGAAGGAVIPAEAVIVELEKPQPRRDGAA